MKQTVIVVCFLGHFYGLLQGGKWDLMMFMVKMKYPQVKGTVAKSLEFNLMLLQWRPLDLTACVIIKPLFVIEVSMQVKEGVAHFAYLKLVQIAQIVLQKYRKLIVYALKS